MVVGLGHLLGQEQTVLAQPPGAAQLAESLLAQKAAQGVGGIDGAIDQHMHDMHVLRGKFRVQCLAQQTSPAHGGGVSVLAGIAAHRRRGRGHQQRALAALRHARQHRPGHSKQRKSGQPPAQFKLLIAGIGQRPLADLRAQIEYHHANRADIALYGGNAFFEHIGPGGVEQEPGGGAAGGANPVHETLQALAVAAPAEHRVIALARKLAAHAAADPRAGADHQTNRLHWLCSTSPALNDHRLTPRRARANACADYAGQK